MPHFCATYRIQFHLNFRFLDAEDLVPYLHALGVTHLYASPRFRARKGSLHGYDVADAARVNSELGTEEEFQRLVPAERRSPFRLNRPRRPLGPPDSRRKTHRSSLSAKSVAPPKPFAISTRKYTILSIVPSAIFEPNRTSSVAIPRRPYDRDCQRDR